MIKIEDIFYRILSEQPGDNPGQLGDPELPGNPEGADGINAGQPQQPRAPKQLSANQQIIARIKEKWKREAAESRPPIELDDNQVENAITFFNNRKNGIRPIQNPAPQGTPNQLEIVALRTRFPEMAQTLTDPVRIRDINNYSWHQIDYYIDRATAVEMEEEISFEIDETSEETQFRTATELWERFPKKVINENGVIVCKMESKEEAMALGRLQNLLAKKYGGSAWCITYRPDRYGHVSNNWTPYRKEKRAFYFILDKNKPESNADYVASIETNQRGGHNFTARPNGTEFNKSWDEIVRKYNVLAGKEHLLPYFDLTPKELQGADLNMINFRESVPENPNPYDFVLQSKKIQQRYCEDPARAIPNKRAFSTLTADLRRSYIGATTPTNLTSRYRCDDPDDTFGILNLISEDRQLLKSLEWKITNELHKPEGLMAIQKPLLKLGLREGLNDKENKYVLYKQKAGEKYGVVHIDTIKWIKPVAYIKSEPMSLTKMEEGKILRARIHRYTLENGADWFYFYYEGDALTNPESKQYMLGKYFDKEEGQNFLDNLKDYGFRAFTKT